MTRSEMIALLKPLLRHSEAFLAVLRFLEACRAERQDVLDRAARNALEGDEAARMIGVRTLGQVAFLTSLSSELESLLPKGKDE